MILRYIIVRSAATWCAAVSVRHDYVTQNGKVVRETVTTDGTVTAVMDFIYDESGRPFALRHSTNGSSFTTYYYVLNLQGDVVKLVNASGTAYATYTYNAWGKLLTATGDMASVNPLRYRGYYYDSETGFFYLQSRYYGPANHRFINADSCLSTETGFLGYNMFAYCNNCPVLFNDPTGKSIISDILEELRKIKAKANEDFEPVNGQAVCKYADVDFGVKKMRDNGCAILAIYNAQGLTGNATYISCLTSYFEERGSVRLFGVFPWEIHEYFVDRNIPHQRAKTLGELDTLLSNGGTAIVTFWNDTIAGSSVPNVFCGAHTVAITYDGVGQYCVYNAFNNVTESRYYNSIEDYIGRGYMDGFYIG